MSASEMVQFSSTDEAREAYYNGSWGEPSHIADLDGGWALSEQEMRDSDRTRYFVLGGPGDTPQAMTRGGGTEEIAEEVTLSDFDSFPSFDTEDDAREAHAAWLEENPEYTSDGNEDSSWSGWDVAEEFPPWYLLQREDENSDAEQYLVVGEDQGKNIYLAPGPEIDDSAPEPYTSYDEAVAVIEAYFAEIENGERDPADGPSGRPPNIDDVEEETGDPSSGGILSTVTGNPVMIGGVVLALIVAYYYYTEVR